MQAVVLAAGISTRLRPLTNNLPKPMLPVCGRPMIEHIVRQLAAYGFHEVIITTHYRAERIRDHLGDGASFGVNIAYAHENALMNTAGSLKRLADTIRDDFMVIGGNDFLPTLDLHDFIRFHKTRGGIGTIAFKRLKDNVLLPLFGQGLLDNDNRLIAFEEKPERNLSSLVHTTYQIYDPRVLDYIPAGISCSIPEYLIRRTLMAGEKIYGYETDSPFICISTKEQYENAQAQLADAMNSPT